jgi:hypothetical protein
VSSLKGGDFFAQNFSDYQKTIEAKYFASKNGLFLGGGIFFLKNKNRTNIRKKNIPLTRVEEGFLELRFTRNSLSSSGYHA